MSLGSPSSQTQTQSLSSEVGKMDFGCYPNFTMYNLCDLQYFTPLLCTTETCEDWILLPYFIQKKSEINFLTQTHTHTNMYQILM